MKIIENKNFPSERALYGEHDLLLKNCSFDGEEDGESALKESANVSLEKCFFNLRYPLWHVDTVRITDCEMSEKCRAALWYSDNIVISDSVLGGIKALRECRNAEMKNVTVNSPEFGWKDAGIKAENCKIQGEYPYFLSRDIYFKNIELGGKYSFQYTENVVIENSVLNTKDAFWHAKNVTVRNSVVNGEYLAWYSEGLTLDHCKIIGTQPLCYCKNLKLIDCETEGADLAFEYSDVDATINGGVISVKNPKKGKIVADEIGEIILTADSKYACDCEIKSRNSGR